MRLTTPQRQLLEKLKAGASIQWTHLGPSVDDRGPCHQKTAAAIARRGWLVQSNPDLAPGRYVINTRGQAALAADKYPAAGNPAMQSAFRRGFADGWVEGLLQPKPECPYADIRKPSGRLSWSRAFVCAWHDGYTAGRAERQRESDPS